MIKIVCDEDNEGFAHRIVEAAIKYCGCPPVDCDNPAANCELCFENYIEVEVVKYKDNENKEPKRVWEQLHLSEEDEAMFSAIKQLIKLDYQFYNDEELKEGE